MRKLTQPPVIINPFLRAGLDEHALRKYARRQAAKYRAARRAISPQRRATVAHLLLPSPHRAAVADGEDAVDAR